MITILKANKERLMEHIEKCTGAVYLQLADGACCDLKADPGAMALLRCMELPLQGISLCVTEKGDIPGFLQCMME